MQSIGTYKADWTKNFKLFADIDLSGYVAEEFNIIGYYKSQHNNKPFAGIFDGNGHTISNFTYDSNGVDYIGIFGYVDGEAAEIKNILLTDPNVRALNGLYVGSLIGYVRSGRITNSDIVGGAISGGSYVGGLVGWNTSGTISDCCASGTVSGGEDSFILGGLVGRNTTGTIANCCASGPITGGGSSFAIGGLVGGSYGGLISNCYATGAVTGGVGSYPIGGLVGTSHGTVNECYATGAVAGGLYSVDLGGLVGSNSGRVLNCHATGTVTGGDNSRLIGGLVGYNTGYHITNCYASGSVTGGDGSYSLGGLVGENSANNFITNCYASGSVTGSEGSYSLGGLVGEKDSGNIDGCFWDVNTSGQASSAGGTGKTTLEMQTESTFTDAGWDFVGETTNGTDDFWDICEGTNYPKFVWQELLGDFVCPDGVSLVDFSYIAAAWYSEDGDGNWDPICDISDPNDNIIDERDLGVFVDNYLKGI